VAHHDLDIEMNFTDTVNPNVNVVFLCSWKIDLFFRNQQFASHTKIIDLGNDFRLTEDKNFKENRLFTVYLN
jgi:N-acetyl-gamma-glutamyl-phosphate reductase